MTTSLEYLISLFAFGYDAVQLYNVVAVANITVDIVNITDDGTTVTLDFDGELTEGDIMVVDGIVGNFVPIYGDGSGSWMYQHLSSSNVGGGSLTSGQWNTRTINSTHNQDGQLIQRTGNQLFLFPGNYEFYINGVTAGVGDFKVRLYNVTASETITESMSNSTHFTYDGTNTVEKNTPFLIIGQTLLTEYSVIEIQEYCAASYSNGMGIPNSSGLSNTYLQVKLEYR